MSGSIALGKSSSSREESVQEVGQTSPLISVTAVDVSSRETAITVERKSLNIRELLVDFIYQFRRVVEKDLKINLRKKSSNFGSEKAKRWRFQMDVLGRYLCLVLIAFLFLIAIVLIFGAVDDSRRNYGIALIDPLAKDQPHSYDSLVISPISSSKFDSLNFMKQLSTINFREQLTLSWKSNSLNITYPLFHRRNSLWDILRLANVQGTFSSILYSSGVANVASVQVLHRSSEKMLLCPVGLQGQFCSECALGFEILRDTKNCHFKSLPNEGAESSQDTSSTMPPKLPLENSAVLNVDSHWSSGFSGIIEISLRQKPTNILTVKCWFVGITQRVTFETVAVWGKESWNQSKAGVLTLNFPSNSDRFIDGNTSVGWRLQVLVVVRISNSPSKETLKSAFRFSISN